MQTKPALYLYPFTKATLREGGNPYIPNLMHHLGRHFRIVNRQTGLGLLHVLLKMPQCNVLYFNWIEDVADKKFGAAQVWLLAFILRVSKIAGIKTVWFVHNNLSHRKKNTALKKKIAALMGRYADVILSHSHEAQITAAKPVAVFHHPVEAYQPLPATAPEYDLLIWGTVNPYKGIAEFLQFNRQSTTLQKYKVLIAGKFASTAYYEEMKKLAAPNIAIQNKILSEPELEELLARSRYVLFTYNAASVLSSAALCKTIGYGKTVIGPNAGAFKELGAERIIYTYSSFPQLEALLSGLTQNMEPAISTDALQQYIQQHSWEAFAAFVAQAVQHKKAKAPLQAVA